MSWPTCQVCGVAHAPARYASNGPARCWHCGRTARRCRCVTGLPAAQVWLPVLVLLAVALLGLVVQLEGAFR